MSPVAMGFLASLTAGALTAVGALPVLAGHSVSRRMHDVLLGFAAGVMLSASFFSLIAPGIETAREFYADVRIAALIAVVGIIAGMAFVAGLNEWVPHEHFRQGPQGPLDTELAKIWLFVLAITIHNLPEGLAVGVGFGGGDISRGLTLAIGIGLQNAPEGLAVAVALLASGYTRVQSFLVASLTGLVEPVAGLAGAYAVSLSQLVLPWALTFAAGAMLYVISHEIIPETHRHGYENQATLGLAIGIVAMLFLDVAFGKS
jgi:ZIP family zinc transporter